MYQEYCKNNNINNVIFTGLYDNEKKYELLKDASMSLFFIRDKKECRQRLGLPENQFIVGFVGGFVERKGDKRLLSAINSLEGVYGAFAGRGDESPKGEKVVFCEALQHEEIPIFLNAVDVFCLPTQNEGSCNAIVEAAACAKPIISSKSGGRLIVLTEMM